MEKSEKQLIRDFKMTFESTHGKRVLEHVKTFCKGNVTQSMFCEESVQQTSYNLGANSVYRYIQYLIDTDLSESEPEDCITEKPEQKGK